MNETRLNNIVEEVLVIIKACIIGLTIDFIIIPLCQSPLLEQHLDTYTTHFSIISAIESDIDEHQINTPYFIVDTIKHHIQLVKNK